MRYFFAVFLLAIALPFYAVAASEDGHEFTSFMGFTLEKATPDDVMKKLGKAELVTTGEAGEFEARMCYFSGSDIIAFAGDEMAGTKRFDMFSIAEKTSESAKNCQPLSAPYATQLHSIAGLHLGMNKEEFAGLAGPVEWKGETGSHYFESKVMMTPQQLITFKVEKGPQPYYFDVGVNVKGTFVNDRLVKLLVSKVTSY